MSKKTLNKANLEALGPARLADLLMEVSTGSADIKRRLRLELSHNLGANELAHEVRKRLVALRKSNSFVGWRKRKALIKDLQTQAQMITQKIAPEDPTLAFDLLWQFTEMAPFIFSRVDDSKGDVGAVFDAAFAHFQDIGPRSMIDPDDLADRVWTALRDNGHGEWDNVIAQMAAPLGLKGLAKLKAHVTAYADAPSEAEAQDHEALQFLRQLRGGASHAQDRKARFVKTCLQDIATAMGDTEAYIAQYSEQELARKDVAAEVAKLLLEKGQPDQAMDVLLGADADQDVRSWDAAYLACLSALGREEEAQAHRWTCFTDTLLPTYLRDYLKGLDDFEDVEAEETAKQHVAQFADFARALNFCLAWPDLLGASELIKARPQEINGNYASVLAPAAEQLRARYPAAAVILWRAMIDYTLEHGLTHRYAQAAEHVMDCEAQDVDVLAQEGVTPQGAYMETLERRHGGKTSFWAKLR